MILMTNEGCLMGWCDRFRPMAWMKNIYIRDLETSSGTRISVCQRRKNGNVLYKLYSTQVLRFFMTVTN
jgi:hypothetical protein